jgi:hypothetical protein
MVEGRKTTEGGVAVFVRRCVGALSDVEIVVPGRVLLASVRFEGCREPLSLGTIDLRTGGKLDEENLEVLERTGRALCDRGQSYFLGGDFQVAPSVVGETGLASIFGGRVAAPASTLGTCGSGKDGQKANTIDFGIVSHGLACSLLDVSVCTSTVANPHRPVLYSFQGPLDQLVVPRVVRRANFPRSECVPVGPRRRPQDWAAGLGAAEAAALCCATLAEVGGRAARAEAAGAVAAAGQAAVIVDRMNNPPSVEESCCLRLVRQRYQDWLRLGGRAWATTRGGGVSRGGRPPAAVSPTVSRGGRPRAG